MDTYQTYAFTLSVWALNILVIIISLTCLLISDPIIYSDSEAYKDYLQMRKKAENNLFKVIEKKKYFYNFIIKNGFINICREIEKLQFLSSLNV